MTACARLIPVAESDLHRPNFRVGEAAWLLNLTYQKTLELIHAGELQARRIGPRVFVVPKVEIDRLSGAVKGGAA